MAYISPNLEKKNVKTCLNKVTVRKVYGQSDSTTALHCLKDNVQYKIFVSNRCLKSKEKVLSNGNTFLRKKIQPILGAEVVKY